MFISKVALAPKPMPASIFKKIVHLCPIINDLFIELDPLHLISSPFIPFRVIKTQKILKIINDGETHLMIGPNTSFLCLYHNANLHGEDLNSFF